MKSIQNLDRMPASQPIFADDVLEFHAGRLLLLFKLCGKSGRIDGLTKMAKLDFFVRYPQFFEAILQVKPENGSSFQRTVESSMIRYHYGPWDTRYYQVLAYLEAKGLLSVSKVGNTIRLELTAPGATIAERLTKTNSYHDLVIHMKEVKKLLGGKTGSQLKRMIYEAFSKEVASRPIGQVIDV